MRKWLSIMVTVIVLIMGVGSPMTIVNANGGKEPPFQDRAYPNTKIVNFQLNSTETLVEHVTPVGNSCKAEYYGCSTGSVHVTVLNHLGQYVTGFTIPYIGYTTCYVYINCTANQQLTFIISPLNNSPATGGFKIHY